MIASGAIIGLLGDALTFSGGFLLAWDAVQKEKEFNKIQRVAAAVTSTSMVRLHVKMEGILISDERDVERAFIRQSARKAAWGCRILTAGFFLLIVTRILEVFGDK
jgi:hypothetical protein